MGVFSTVVDGILAAVSQRAFWTEIQIREFVRDDNEKTMEALHKSKAEIRLNELHAMRIFATHQQQTWIVTDGIMAYCVLDDRRREQPRIQWSTGLENIIPVNVGLGLSTTTGVLHFGNRTKEWLYSKELFPGEPADVAVNRFLSDNNRRDTCGPQ